MTLKHFYYKKNRIQQLKGFYNTVQTGSISKSAEKMGLSQSAVTLQIQSLERDLGIKLFKRDSKKIKLTEDGKLLYAQSSHFIQGIDDIFEGFTEFVKEKNKNTLSIASNHAGISYILPKPLKKIKEIHPGAKFKIQNLPQEECIKRILDGDIDIFIYPMKSDQVPDELEFIPIVKYQPILITKKGHPLTKIKDLSLSDIARYELIRIDPKLITLPSFEEIIQIHNFKTSVEFESADWEILKKFVKADIGIAMISNIVIDEEDENLLDTTLLTQHFPQMTYGILIKKGKIPKGILKNFLYIIKECFL